MKRTLRALLIVASAFGVSVTAIGAQPSTLVAPPPRPALRPLPVPANAKLPSLFLIGASDVRNGRGDGSDKGLWGWGEPLAKYFDDAKINVVNRAVGGLSGRTYQTMGYWEATLALMKPGDFLIIAFSPYDPRTINDPQRPHGMLVGLGEETVEIDNVVTKQHEVVHTFGWYERKFSTEARARGVNPILCSQVAVKIWNAGIIVRAFVASGAEAWVVEIARTAGLDYLPLYEIIARRYDALGQKRVESLFGRDEVIHTNVKGADLNAQCVITALKALKENPLTAYFSAKAADVAPYDPTASPLVAPAPAAEPMPAK